MVQASRSCHRWPHEIRSRAIARRTTQPGGSHDGDEVAAEDARPDGQEDDYRGRADPAPVERIKLAELERKLTAAFREQGVTEPTHEQIAALGDPIVEAGAVVGYTSARYGQGRWVSSAVLRRVAKAL